MTSHRTPKMTRDRVLECGDSSPLCFVAGGIFHCSLRWLRFTCSLRWLRFTRARESGDESPHSKGLVACDIVQIAQPEARPVANVFQEECLAVAPREREGFCATLIRPQAECGGGGSSTAAVQQLACFRDREILRRSRSTSSTLTRTTSPTATTSLGFST